MCPNLPAVPTDLVSSSVAAKMIGVSRQRVYQLVAEGRLQALKVATSENRTQLVFRRTEIERFKEREPRPWR
ncbi:MAG: helix-turn-helix domain-containing protein [Actinomycetota bacterium]